MAPRRTLLLVATTVQARLGQLRNDEQQIWKRISSGKLSGPGYRNEAWAPLETKAPTRYARTQPAEQWSGSVPRLPPATKGAKSR